MPTPHLQLNTYRMDWEVLDKDKTKEERTEIYKWEKTDFRPDQVKLLIKRIYYIIYLFKNNRPGTMVRSAVCNS